jgi:hypothetical protein
MQKEAADCRGSSSSPLKSLPSCPPLRIKILTMGSGKTDEAIVSRRGRQALVQSPALSFFAAMDLPPSKGADGKICDHVNKRDPASC